MEQDEVIPLTSPKEAAREGLGPYGSWPYVERRSGGDRRGRPTRFFSRYVFFGKRTSGRRRGEAANIYVDRYGPHDVLLASSVIVLNILDALFTLAYLHQGGQEGNPVARFLMSLSPETNFFFLFSKSFVIIVCVLFLVMHKTFRFVRPALYLLLSFYGLLCLYHLWIQLHYLGQLSASL